MVLKGGGSVTQGDGLEASELVNVCGEEETIRTADVPIPSVYGMAKSPQMKPRFSWVSEG